MVSSRRRFARRLRAAPIQRFVPGPARALVVLVALAPAVWLLTACAGEEPAPPVADPTTLRSTSQGEIEGFVSEDGAHVWRGIPFAAPPLGELRWRAPRPPQPWQGTFQALQHGSGCVQFGGPLAGGGEEGKPTGVEDCLYLDVYAPARAGVGDASVRGQESELLPVMVWIHGGGNTIGSAKIYDGSVLAVKQRVVVVTIQYRLGVFGWFSHPALAAAEADPLDRSGNYGTLDLIRALEWVRDEIPAFGGDPARVTVFGESAGGTNVFSLLLSPRAKGLFQRAIAQSGGPPDTPVAEAVNLVDDPEPGDAFSSGEVILRLLVAEGRAADRAAAKPLVAAMSPDAIRDYLRARTAGQLLEVYDGTRMGGMYSMPKLLRDGVVLPAEPPDEVFAAGGQNRVPVILGTNRDETKLFALMGSPHVRSLFRIPLWFRDERRYQLENEYGTLIWKARGVDEPAALLRGSQGPSVFAYRFDWDEEGSLVFADLSKMLGAAHGLEIPFVFGRLRLFGAERFIFPDESRAGAKALSDAMMSYWAQFAYTGDPGHGAEGRLPRWQSWHQGDREVPKFIVFDSEAGGGIRMSGESVTRKAIVERVAGDERLRSADERCVIYRDFVERSGFMTAAEYAEVGNGECRAHPLGG